MKLYRVFVGLLKKIQNIEIRYERKPLPMTTNTSAGSLSGHRHEKVIRCVKVCDCAVQYCVFVVASLVAQLLVVSLAPSIRHQVQLFIYVASVCHVP